MPLLRRRAEVRRQHTRHLPEHLVTHRQDEREAVIALHPTDRNSHQVTMLAEDAATRDAWVAVGQAGHEAVCRALSYVAGAENDALGIVVTETEERLRELVAERRVEAQRRQVEVAVHPDDGPVTRMHFHVGIAGVNEVSGKLLTPVLDLD